MSNCNTKNCCFHGIDLVVKCYDPQPEFKDFTVPTFWFNRCNGKLFLLKEIDADGKAVWIDITSGGSGGSGIEQILTECGLVKPDSEGQIKVKGSCGIRLKAEGCEDLCVDILTGFGLKGGGRVCCGESLKIELDTDFVGDVVSPNPAEIGDVPKYKDTTGKVIVPSNINSVDGLTKITKSSKGEQKLLVETVDTEAGSDAGVEAKSTGSGTPYFQLTQGENKWRRIINPETGALEVRPTDDLSKGSVLSMLPNGVMLMPWQPKATATLGRTPTFPPSTELELGTNLSFKKIRDEDGYNTSANNFFVGESGKRAYYKAPYRGSYFVKYQFLLDTGETSTTNIPAYAKIFWGKDAGLEFSAYNRNRFATPAFITINDSGIIFLEKDDIIHINVNVQGGNPYITVRDQSERAIENYWEVVFLG